MPGLAQQCWDGLSNENHVWNVFWENKRKSNGCSTRILPSSTISSKNGHLWPHKTKMVTVVMPNSRLQNGAPQTSGWCQGGFTLDGHRDCDYTGWHQHFAHVLLSPTKHGQCFSIHPPWRQFRQKQVTTALCWHLLGRRPELRAKRSS